MLEHALQVYNRIPKPKARWEAMTMRKSTDILSELHLLDWKVLLVGWQRGWIEPSDLSKFAFSCIASDITDNDLAPIASLASAETLALEEIERYLARLARCDQDQYAMKLECWRFAKLISLREQDMAWDDKVTRLEELAAEFGYPSDMNGCSRYSPGTSDPLDEMNLLIQILQVRLCVS